MAIDHDIPMALRAAYLSMHRRTDACFTQYDVTANQFVLLALLAEEDGITQRQLAARASSDANTIRAMLVLLEKQGLVARRLSPDDARARNVTITRKGRKVFDILMAESDSLRKEMLASFRKDELALFVTFLDRIRNAMTAPQ